MARFFIANGVKAGDRVAVLLDRGPEAYAALFALMKARAAYVPLDANHPVERMGYVLRDASVSACRYSPQGRRPVRRFQGSPNHPRQSAR